MNGRDFGRRGKSLHFIKAQSLSKKGQCGEPEWSESSTLKEHKHDNQMTSPKDRWPTLRIHRGQVPAQRTVVPRLAGAVRVPSGLGFGREQICRQGNTHRRFQNCMTYSRGDLVLLGNGNDSIAPPLCVPLTMPKTNRAPRLAWGRATSLSSSHGSHQRRPRRSVHGFFARPTRRGTP